MVEAIAGDAHLIGREAVKHEGIVGVRTMRDGDVAQRGSTGGFGVLEAHWEDVLSKQKTAMFLGCGYEILRRKR
jgi:hypothetical protein